MAHIASIGSGNYSDLSIATPVAELTPTALAALNTAAAFQALFASEINTTGGTRAAGAFIRVKNVREFPAMGVPANIVNVPAYGQATSSQIQGQADAPSLELTLNYIAADWAKDVAGQLLAPMVNDAVSRVFRFSLLNSPPTGTTATAFASSSTGLGTTQNSQFFWVGKVEALQVNPQLTDANTAALTLSMQGSFFGPFTS